MEMRLTPLDAGGQRCESFRLTTDPPGEVRSYVDRFGNRVRHFDTLNPHDRLLVSARSEVSTPEAFVDPERELSLLDCLRLPAADAVRAGQRGRADVRPRPGRPRRRDGHGPGRAAGRARSAGLHAGRDDGQDDRGRGARRGARRVPGLRPPHDRGLPRPRPARALRERLRVRAATRHRGRLARLGGRLRGGSRVAVPRSHPRLRRRPTTTSASPWAATTPTSRPPAASTRARARRRWRSTSGSSASDRVT